MPCVCQLINNTFVTEENLVMYRSEHVPIAFQLLEMSSITIPNQTISNVHTRFICQRVFLEKNISDYTNLPNEKNQSGSFV